MLREGSQRSQPSWEKQHFLFQSKSASQFKELKPDKNKPQPYHIDLAKYMNLKEGDTVQVLFGRDKGKQGVIRKIIHSTNQVIVTDCNMMKPFWHPRPVAGGPSLITVETPIHVTNIAPLDPIIKKPTRIKKRVTMFGEVVRMSKLSGSAMPDPQPVPIISEQAAEFKIRESKRRQIGGHAPVAHQYQDDMKAKHYYQMLCRIVQDTQGTLKE